MPSLLNDTNILDDSWAELLIDNIFLVSLFLKSVRELNYINHHISFSDLRREEKSWYALMTCI